MNFGLEGDVSMVEERVPSRPVTGEGDGLDGTSRKHGTDSGYKAGCRCVECREGHRLAVRDQRAKKRADNRIVHGTSAAYDVGCRCTDCQDARRRRARKRASRKRETVTCPVCKEKVGLYPDGSIATHGKPFCKGSRHVPNVKPLVVVVGYWRDYAACLGEKTELFYPERGASAAPGRRICKSCPVQAECLNDAIISNDRHGIRGGLTEKERRRMKPGYAA